jgi:hypothetical protein
MKNFGLPLVLTAIILSVVYRNNHYVTADSKFVQQLYDKSDDTIWIDSNLCFLETFLCRNMKSSQYVAGNNEVSALIYLVDSENLRIVMGVTITGLYIINEKEVWNSSVPVSNAGEFRLTKISEAGPGWETKVYVDVIAEIEVPSTGERRYIIARDQYFADL